MNVKVLAWPPQRPYNAALRRFALRHRENVIYCTASQGPDFGATGNEMLISDDCDTKKCSCDALGTAYDNNTSISGDDFLSGNVHFLMREIEVLKVSK
jgi:hypothetical protein